LGDYTPLLGLIPHLGGGGIRGAPPYMGGMVVGRGG